VLIDAGLCSTLPVLGLTVGFGLAANSPRDLIAVHSGEANIEQDHVGLE
jgi:hypothetical protein